MSTISGFNKVEISPKLLNSFEAIFRKILLIRHASGHASLANEKAMELFSINKKTEDIEGGEIFRDISDENRKRNAKSSLTFEKRLLKKNV